MTTQITSRRIVGRCALVCLVVVGAICCARDAAAKKVYVSDFGVGSYLHHRLGIHDYLYGPGGVVPRTTGLPAQRRTQRYAAEQGYWRLATDRPTRPFVERRVVVRPRTDRTRSTQRTERFEDFGLAINLPGRPWTKLDPQEMGSRACLILERNSPTVCISLAAERLDSESDVTNESLLSTSQAKMLSFPGGSVESGKKFHANGIEGIAYEATVRAADDQEGAHYWIWVATRNGHKYSVAVYGEEKHASAIDASARDFVSGIHQNHSTRVTRGEAKTRRK